MNIQQTSPHCRGSSQLVKCIIRRSLNFQRKSAHFWKKYRADQKFRNCKRRYFTKKIIENFGWKLLFWAWIFFNWHEIWYSFVLNCRWGSFCNFLIFHPPPIAFYNDPPPSPILRIFRKSLLVTQTSCLLSSFSCIFIFLSTLSPPI